MSASRSVALALSAALVACSVAAPVPDDVDVVEEVTETAELEGVEEVVLRCYCPRRNVRQEPGHPEVTIKAVGRLTSHGYHGRQPREDLRAMLRTRLRFSQRREGSRLFVRLGPEMGGSMHHAWGLSELWIALPSDRRLRIEPLPLPSAEVP